MSNPHQCKNPDFPAELCMVLMLWLIRASTPILWWSEAYNKTPLFIYLCGIIQIPVHVKINQTDGFISDSMSQNSTIPFKCYIYANTFFLFKEESLWTFYLLPQRLQMSLAERNMHCGIPVLSEYCNNCDSSGRNIPSMKLGLLLLWSC